jgi:MoxR-like ATPase
VFSSVPEVSEGLRKAGYIAIFVAATIVFLAASLHRPVSTQGPAGSGQSQLAYAVAAAESTTVEWLQCYEGINEARPLGSLTNRCEGCVSSRRQKLPGLIGSC